MQNVKCKIAKNGWPASDRGHSTPRRAGNVHYLYLSMYPVPTPPSITAFYPILHNICIAIFMYTYTNSGTITSGTIIIYPSLPLQSRLVELYLVFLKTKSVQ